MTKAEEKVTALQQMARVLVQTVKDYAHQNYEKGWDLVVETMSDDDIAHIIEGATSPMGAKRKMSAYIGPMIDHRRDIQGA